MIAAQHSVHAATAKGEAGALSTRRLKGVMIRRLHALAEPPRKKKGLEVIQGLFRGEAN